MIGEKQSDEVRGERLVCIFRKEGSRTVVPQTGGHRATRLVVKGPARPGSGRAGVGAGVSAEADPASRWSESGACGRAAATVLRSHLHRFIQARVCRFDLTLALTVSYGFLLRGLHITGQGKSCR